MNHSNNPNVDGSVTLVNGLKRIGFFAVRDIPAQSEVGTKLAASLERQCRLFCSLKLLASQSHFASLFKLFYNYGDMFVSDKGKFRWQRQGSRDNQSAQPGNGGDGECQRVALSDSLLYCGVCDENNKDVTSRPTQEEKRKLVKTRRKTRYGCNKCDLVVCLPHWNCHPKYAKTRSKA